jgi:hypothetical protein
MSQKKDKQVIEDKRVIDLRNNNNIPYIPWPSEPIQLTLCAGDGVQRYNDTPITDIQWFTTDIEGFSRQHKPTNVFCCSPDYNLDGLNKNIKYLEQHKNLKILLVLCDTTNPLHLQRFKELFKNRITTIREDMACYGQALSTEILQNVLVTGGQYIIDDHRKYNMYLEPSVARTDEKFTYKLEAPNKLIITKISPTEEPLSSQDNLLPPPPPPQENFLPRATKKRQLAGTRRKKRKSKNKEGGHRGKRSFPYKIEPINK